MDVESGKLRTERNCESLSEEAIGKSLAWKKSSKLLRKKNDETPLDGSRKLSDSSGLMGKPMAATRAIECLAAYAVFLEHANGCDGSMTSFSYRTRLEARVTSTLVAQCPSNVIVALPLSLAHRLESSNLMVFVHSIS